MILKDVEHQIINEFDQCGIHYLICKDNDKKEIQRYMVVRSEQDRAFWRLLQKGEPIKETKSQYRDTIVKIFQLLAVNESH